ncbi:hypothetical protein DPMN_158883 [Dreissena polymorpha]|nr:hypothetical protein DPMN_158883 [Dreissena polymorpha]
MLLCFAVFECAVSPTGDKLYITSKFDKLLTLARNGTLLATLTDPDLYLPHGIHVTPAGQVLLCGGVPQAILQVGGKGRRKLATLATHKDGVRSPLVVCYSGSTSSIIVGQNGDNILV